MAKNAIELLKADHETVRKLLNEISETTERAEKTRGELLERIASELSVHTRIEEEIFYPALRDAGEKEESVMVYEAREEHRAVDELVLPDLEKTEVGSMEFSGRVKVLKELIEHHADEEEEEMFPKAEQLLSEAELEELEGVDRLTLKGAESGS
jgi:hemerythrin-like domain-containing protein